MTFNDSLQKTNHQELMGRLTYCHEAISRLIQKNPVHYVDLPLYGNIGDLLIMKGTLAFLEKNQILIRTLTAYFNFNPAWVNSQDIILFQGGGNFGDLYPGPQQLRERTISQCLENRIIILPQTIQFNSAQAYESCCELMSKHADLHIFVRDQKSYKLAKPMSRHVYLAPDMAHQLWEIKHTPQRKAGKGHLGIIRTDDEAGTGSHYAGFNHVTDWPALVGRREILARNTHRLLRALHLAGIDRKLVTPMSRLWIQWADVLIGDAINLYSKFEHVTTDRLHGHILACLMGISNTFIDNSYGKNSTYAAQWTANSSIVNLAVSFELGNEYA